MFKHLLNQTVLKENSTKRNRMLETYSFSFNLKKKIGLNKIHKTQNDIFKRLDEGFLFKNQKKFTLANNSTMSNIILSRPRVFLNICYDIYIYIYIYMCVCVCLFIL